MRWALELEPGSVDTRVMLAATIALRGRLDEAVALLARAQGLDPDRHARLADMIHVLLRAGQTDDALRIAQELVERYPDSPAIQTALGWAFVHAERPLDAARGFDRALALAPEEPDARAGRAAVFSIIGEHRSALDEFSRLIEIDPNYFARNGEMQEYWAVSKAAIDDGR